MNEEQPYSWVSRRLDTQWSDAQQKAVTGLVWTVTWLPNGQTLNGFTPGNPPTPAQVDASIRAAGALDERYQQLGG